MNSSNLDFLNYVYELMRGVPLVDSKGEFSEAWLGKSRSYLTSMTAKRRNIDIRMLQHLAFGLRFRATTFHGNPHLGRAEAQRLNRTYQRLNDISAIVTAHVLGQDAFAGGENDFIPAVGFKPPTDIKHMLPSQASAATEIIARLRRRLKG